MEIAITRSTYLGTYKRRNDLYCEYLGIMNRFLFLVHRMAGVNHPRLTLGSSEALSTLV
jgi:hypothetical protein